jgi:membrane protein implicated in regulation of membrane protease activity
MNAPAADTTSGALADDRGDGLAMFLIFAAAALIVTGAVALLALVGSWWMLSVAFAVDVAITAVVTLTIVGAMNGRLDAIQGWAMRTRLASQRQARRGPAAAR